MIGVPNAPLATGSRMANARPVTRQLALIATSKVDGAESARKASTSSLERVSHAPGLAGSASQQTFARGVTLRSTAICDQTVVNVSVMVREAGTRGPRIANGTALATIRSSQLRVSALLAIHSSQGAQNAARSANWRLMLLFTCRCRIEI